MPDVRPWYIQRVHQPLKSAIFFGGKILVLVPYAKVKETVKDIAPRGRKQSQTKNSGEASDGYPITATAASTSVSNAYNATDSSSLPESEINVDVSNHPPASDTPVARNLRVDERGIYVDIEGREHFFTWDQFEQFLLDPRNTEHLPADDVVRRTADILRENKKAKA
ncbi:hypothetical protein BT69DRAFT_1275661 [Atractiella rhizophila]|nr:hypothetical protein BT69DRAFT_1275661 [Atractiella rhizophila]